ncbi:MAG: hypothetical protein HQL19_00410 [Candidatus Omnitrophica bacterium]|nr:hypothetical protein [Candidatus Omnitrophota bacterium]
MKKTMLWLVLAAFILNGIMPPAGYAQVMSAVGMMPEPGVQMGMSAAYTPAHLRGMVIDPQNPFKFDFIIHRGNETLAADQKQEEYTKLIKYFLAALAIPETDQWVNLSPYEKDRIVADNFGQTEMGRDLLAQDYILKQISASLTNPDTDLGKKFWDGVYQKAYEKFGTTDVPTDTFSKVWIVPSTVKLYQKDNVVYVLESSLKVMTETDYLAMKNNVADDESAQKDVGKISLSVMREVIIPAIEKEVNEGQNFAPLRQIYSGMLLATWYKLALKESILTKVYGDRSKIKGVDQDPKNNVEIFEKYTQAFKKGVFSMIKEDTDRFTQEVIPRKYFSGGYDNAMAIPNMVVAMRGAQGVVPPNVADTVASGSDLVPTVFNQHTPGKRNNTNESAMTIIAPSNSTTGQVTANDVFISSVAEHAKNAKGGHYEVGVKILAPPGMQVTADTWNEFVRDQRQLLQVQLLAAEKEARAAGVWAIPVLDVYQENGPDAPGIPFVIFRATIEGNAAMISGNGLLSGATGYLRERSLAAEAAYQIERGDLHYAVRGFAGKGGARRNEINLRALPRAKGRIFALTLVVLQNQLEKIKNGQLDGLLTAGQAVEIALTEYKYNYNVADDGFNDDVNDGFNSLFKDVVNNVVKDAVNVEKVKARIEEELRKEYSRAINAVDNLLSQVDALKTARMAPKDITWREALKIHVWPTVKGNLWEIAVAIFMAGTAGLFVQQMIDYYANNAMTTEEIVHQAYKALVNFEKVMWSDAMIHQEMKNMIKNLQAFQSAEDGQDKMAVRAALNNIKISSDRLNDFITNWKIDAGDKREADMNTAKTQGLYFIADVRGFVVAKQALMDQGENAMNQPNVPYGGIDLNSSTLNMQIKRDGKGMPLPISQQNLDNIQIDGLVPVILDIKPATTLPLFSQAAMAGSSA